MSPERRPQQREILFKDSDPTLLAKTLGWKLVELSDNEWRLDCPDMENGAVKKDEHRVLNVRFDKNSGLVRLTRQTDYDTAFYRLDRVSSIQIQKAKKALRFKKAGGSIFVNSDGVIQAFGADIHSFVRR